MLRRHLIKRLDKDKVQQCSLEPSSMNGKKHHTATTEEEKRKVMKSGENVTGGEVDRIEALSPEAKEQEIAAMVRESGRTDDEAERLAALLRLFYARPNRYVRVPGIDSDLHMSPRPFPYEIDLQYLLWQKLIASRHQRIVAQTSDHLYVCIQKGIGSNDRLMLSWGDEREQLGSMLSKNAVYADALEDEFGTLIEQAKAKGIDVDAISLDQWEEVQ